MYCYPRGCYTFYICIAFNIVPLAIELWVCGITTVILVIFLYLTTDPGTLVRLNLTKVGGAPYNYYTIKSANKDYTIILYLYCIENKEIPRYIIILLL